MAGKTTTIATVAVPAAEPVTAMEEWTTEAAVTVVLNLLDGTGSGGSGIDDRGSGDGHGGRRLDGGNGGAEGDGCDQGRGEEA